MTLWLGADGPKPDSRILQSLIFDEFEAYAQAVQDADLWMMLPKRELSYWKICSLDIGPFHLQIGSEGSGIIAEGQSRSDGWILFLPLTGESPLICGVPVDCGSIFLIRPGSEVCFAYRQRHEWASVFVPDSFIQRSFSLSQQAHALTFEPNPLFSNRRSFEVLRSLISRFRESVEVDSAAFSEPSCSVRFERSIARCVTHCLGISNRNEQTRGRPKFDRSEILRLAIDRFESSPHEFLSMQDLADFLNISPRTLQNAFKDRYGIAPKDFFKTMRMNRVRKKLLASTPYCTTVTSTCAQNGFWEFGRFAVEYHKMFGEKPSETLRRPN